MHIHRTPYVVSYLEHFGFINMSVSYFFLIVIEDARSRVLYTNYEVIYFTVFQRGARECSIRHQFMQHALTRSASA